MVGRLGFLGGNMDYLKLYNDNADFKIYVDKYCVTYRVTVDVALSHRLVKEVAIFYGGK